MGEHSIETLQDRDGEVTGAPVFLSPEEVEEIRETGSVEIQLKE